MIVSDRYRFVFIHVPKCAGTSVRAAILPYHDADGRFLKAVERHPELGDIDFRHLPLGLLRDLDPEAFEKLREYDSFALLRDPFERFRSAMAQRAKMYLGKELAQFDEDDLRSEIDAVITYLQSDPAVIVPEFIHFTRQSDFVQIGGERLVRKLYPVERLDLFMEELGQCIGTDMLRVDHMNRTTVFRHPKLRHVMHSGSALARRFLPGPFHERLRLSARRIFMKPSEPAALPGFGERHVQDFIRSYYADDIALHREVLKDMAG